MNLQKKEASAITTDGTNPSALSDLRPLSEVAAMLARFSSESISAAQNRVDRALGLMRESSDIEKLRSRSLIGRRFNLTGRVVHWLTTIKCKSFTSTVCIEVYIKEMIRAIRVNERQKDRDYTSAEFQWHHL
jgi:hypothetical protein